MVFESREESLSETKTIDLYKLSDEITQQELHQTFASKLVLFSSAKRTERK